jgi:hypothetical protein
MNLINETDYKEISNCLNDIINIVVKKEKKRLCDKKYYENNKKKIMEKSNEWYKNNKEHKRLYDLVYHEENKEKKKKQSKKRYYEKYDEIKKYRQSQNGKKSTRIYKWKKRGLICDDYNLIYEKYLNTLNCDNCNCLLTIDRYLKSSTKCMDHDHNTGLFRNILCHSCNTKIR